MVLCAETTQTGALEKAPVVNVIVQLVPEPDNGPRKSLLPAAKAQPVPLIPVARPGTRLVPLMLVARA